MWPSGEGSGLHDTLVTPYHSEELKRVPGLFESPVEAAYAHDEHALTLLGSKAELNFVPRPNLLRAYAAHVSWNS